MTGFIESILDNELKPKRNHIIIDFTNLSFITPEGVVILHNIALWLTRNNVKTQFQIPRLSNSPGQANALKYLDDTGFFQLHLHERLWNSSKLRSTTIEIKEVAIEQYIQWLNFTFFPWLSGRLNQQETGFAELNTCLQEIFNNIRDHSQEDIGCVFAQHYPAKNRVDISISDFGVGIPNTVKKVNALVSDEKALALATEEGFTSGQTIRNRGAGLHYLLECVTLTFNGCLKIYSGFGELKSYSRNNAAHYRTTKNNCFYPGTLLSISVDDRIIFTGDEEEDFSW